MHALRRGRAREKRPADSASSAAEAERDASVTRCLWLVAPGSDRERDGCVPSRTPVAPCAPLHLKNNEKKTLPAHNRPSIYA